MAHRKTIELRPFMDIGGHLESRELLTASMSAAHDVWVAARDGSGTLVLRYAGGAPATLKLPAHNAPVDHVQPLIRDEILLVHANAPDNAHVYDDHGRLKRTLALGHGVAEVQTTQQHHIWVSYDARGIRDGAPGVACFDAQGTRLFAYDARDAHTDPLTDCEALNAVGDSDVWTYFREGFPLVWIGPNNACISYKSGVQDAHAVAVGDGHALFIGAEGEPGRLDLLVIGKRRLQPVAGFVLVDEARAELRPRFVHARGDAIFFMQGTRCYRFTVQDIMDAA